MLRVIYRYSKAEVLMLSHNFSNGIKKIESKKVKKIGIVYSI